jgi:hypothetical protein
VSIEEDDHAHGHDTAASQPAEVEAGVTAQSGARLRGFE